jgi:predicted TIM-barrel fold metal-dependent hydrolase
MALTETRDGVNRVSVSTGAMDCDTHFWQPLDLWRPHIDREFEPAVVDYHRASDPLGKGSVDPAVEAKIRERMANPAVEDPHERLRWMDSEGLYLNVVFQYPAWFSFCADPEIAVAGCRALNRWSAGFAAVDRDRLKPAMLLPVLHPELAVREFRYANEELGLDVVFAAPTPHRDRRWSDPVFDPLWSAIQVSGAVMMFHEFTRIDNGDLPLVSRPCYKDSYPIDYLCGHVVEAQLVITDMIGGGALERFPELKVGVVEAHTAWLPGWLALMDSVWPRLSSRYASTAGTGTLAMKPSEYFRRQCFVVAFPDDVWISETIGMIGAGSITLCSDFPHPNAAERTPVADVFRKKNPQLSEADQQLIINGNSRRLFGLGARR